MFSFFSGLVTKKQDFDHAPDDAEAGFVDAAPAFVPPAPLAHVAPPVEALPLAEPADVPSDAERALAAEIREHQRLAEERLAERRERERELERLRLEEQRAREERRREVELRDAERRERERAEDEAREAARVEAERARHTWPATLLQHAEAMEYGDAARRNLISMIVELHDPKLGRILHDALYEERADGLRPEVLAALRRAYHDESLRETYERFARIGNEAEREIASDGLLALDAGEG